MKYQQRRKRAALTEVRRRDNWPVGYILACMHSPPGSAGAPRSASHARQRLEAMVEQQREQFQASLARFRRINRLYEILHMLLHPVVDRVRAGAANRSRQSRDEPMFVMATSVFGSPPSTRSSRCSHLLNLSPEPI